MSLILADTSVWIDFFKSGKSLESQKLTQYLEEDAVCITEIIRTELLSGARTENEFHLLHDRFSSIPVLTEFKNFWDTIARFRFQLGRKGIQSAITDLTIAALAYYHHVPLLTRDKEFEQIAKLVPFQFVK